MTRPNGPDLAAETKGDIAMTATARTQSTDLANAIDANVPVLLMGAPGTAKTATLEAIAAERGAYLEVLIASQQDPTTILGIPMPTEDRLYTQPTTPQWARRINEAHDEGRPTILFLDELTTCPPVIIAPLLGVVQSRRADGWTLPADTRIVAAANPPDLAVGGYALDAAMANRWLHIDWAAPVADWVAWSAAQPSPTLRLVSEYIDAMGSQALLQVPTDIRQRAGAWPSPRSWTNGARLADASGDIAMVALAVGGAAAATFTAWAAMRDVPTVADLLSGAATLPTRPDAFATAISNLVDEATDDTAERTIAILVDAVGTDPGAVLVQARRLGARGYVAGIAPLVDALSAAGIEVRPQS